MNLKAHPTEIALALLNRSTCSVQVAAVLVDDFGVYAWGWNSAGPDGMGEHAEEHCLRRSNKARWDDSIIYVAARRKRNKRTVTAKPCEKCMSLLKKVGGVMYQDGEGHWRTL